MLIPTTTTTTTKKSSESKFVSSKLSKLLSERSFRRCETLFLRTVSTAKTIQLLSSLYAFGVPCREVRFSTSRSRFPDLQPGKRTISDFCRPIKGAFVSILHFFSGNLNLESCSDPFPRAEKKRFEATPREISELICSAVMGL